MNIGLIVVAVIVVIIGIYLITTYNLFVTLSNKIKEAYSTMDIYLKKRYDLIPNFVETVKGYAAHEKSTLENVIKARNMAMSATDIDSRADGENILSNTLKSLFALSENYPELKANTNFIDLQNKLSVMEEEIASSRKYYNAIVNQYNTKAEMLPSSFVANIFGFSIKPLFEVSSEEQRENVEVKF